MNSVGEVGTGVAAYVAAGVADDVAAGVGEVAGAAVVTGALVNEGVVGEGDLNPGVPTP